MSEKLGGERARSPPFRARNHPQARMLNRDDGNSNWNAERRALFGNGARARALAAEILRQRVSLDDVGLSADRAHPSCGGRDFAVPRRMARFPRVRDQFLLLRRLEPAERAVRRGDRDLRNHRHVRDCDGDRACRRHRHRGLSHRAVSALVAAADRHRHRTVGRHSEHHLRNLGLVHLRAVAAAIRAAVRSSRCSPTFR